MKTKNYTHLITIGEVEAKMIQELLMKQGIPSRLHASSTADVLAGSAVHGNLSYEVRVPEELLEKAKKLLNLEKSITIPKEKHGYPRWVIIVAWIFISFVIIFAVIAYFLPKF